MATQKNPPQVLRYPYEALTEKTDYLQITLIEKNITPFTNADTLGSLSTKLTNRRSGVFNPDKGNTNVRVTNETVNREVRPQLAKQIITSGDVILLPMPSSINDTNQVSYSDDTLDAITAALAGQVGSLAKTKLFDAKGSLNTTEIQQKLGQMMSRIEKASPLISNLILTNLASQAASLAGTGNLSLNQALARTSGQIINPNMELLFNGPTIRNFRFSFKMTPRSKEEADQIKLIIRSLKKHMSPRDSTSNEPGSNYFLSAPNIFELRYKNGTNDHQYLNRFKRCVLENMSVNYTGENVYATYPDGQPVSTVMDLTFKELEPIYASDYNSGEGTIGTGY